MPSFNFPKYSRIFKSLIILLKISIIFCVISIISSCFEYQFLSYLYEIDKNYTNYINNDLDVIGIETKANTIDVCILIISVIQTILYIITTIYYGRWIYFANKYSRVIGAKAMQFTPGWSVGWYFIPIASLWKPYQAMKEIWKTSNNPENWQGLKTPIILRYWWFLWIAQSLLGRYLYRNSLKAEELEELMSLSGAYIISDVVQILLCLVSIIMITEIYNFQKDTNINNDF